MQNFVTSDALPGDLNPPTPKGWRPRFDCQVATKQDSCDGEEVLTTWIIIFSEQKQAKQQTGRKHIELP